VQDRDIFGPLLSDGVNRILKANYYHQTMIKSSQQGVRPLAGKTTIIKQLGDRRIIIADSVTAATDKNRGDVLVCGSHCGANVGQIAATNKIGALIGNDAGMGKNNAGIAGLAICDTHDIPAAAVASMSAVIGSGVSTYEEGEVSAVNSLAARLGVSEGMSAKQAAERFLETLAKKTTPKEQS